MNNRPKTSHGFARLIIGDGSAVSEQKNIIWNMIGSFLYAFVSVLAVLSSGWFVRMGGIQGGAFVYMLLMAALMVFFGIFSAGFMKQKERAQKHDEG